MKELKDFIHPVINYLNYPGVGVVRLGIELGFKNSREKWDTNEHLFSKAYNL